MARLVVVACEVVALSAVKFCSVVEPVAKIFEAVMPPLNVSAVEVALLGNGYPMVLVTVTLPVEPESEMPEPAASGE